MVVDALDKRQKIGVLFFEFGVKFLSNLFGILRKVFSYPLLYVDNRLNFLFIIERKKQIFQSLKQVFRGPGAHAKLPHAPAGVYFLP